MKTKIFISLLMSLLFASTFAQDRTTVNATSSEISDNLDLRAVASIFGDSKNLEDFENRLNDPKTQISNLDLNNDNQVDYLRVIESVEGRTHLIVVQSVLGKDTFQDVATIEVEKDKHNNVQVQVVGDVYMYGHNYIYEPVYVSTPIIYDYFWINNYRPYCSSWYWNYYPTYYYYWTPFPIFRYRHHLDLCINFNNYYNYSNYRRCEVAYNHYYDRRGNGYEKQHPDRSFSHRNENYGNRYELEQTRVKTRNDVAFNNPRNTNPRSASNDSPRENANPKGNESPREVSTPRSNQYDAPRENPRSVRTESTPREVVTPRSNQYDSPRENPKSVRTESTPREVSTPRSNQYNAPRENPRSSNNSSPRGSSETRSSGRR
jgi:hypothetical protein